jgi:hypothetical protein
VLCASLPWSLPARPKASCGASPPSLSLASCPTWQLGQWASGSCGASHAMSCFSSSQACCHQHHCHQHHCHAVQAAVVICSDVFANLLALCPGCRFGLQGPTTAPSTACATGVHALGDAFRMVQRGEADIMVRGLTSTLPAAAPPHHAPPPHLLLLPLLPTLPPPPFRSAATQLPSSL